MNPLPEASAAYLRGRLEIVEARVRAAVALRRASDPDKDDRFRGLYLADHHVDRLLAQQSAPSLPDHESAKRLTELESDAAAAEERGEDIRLRRLARSFSLDEFDVELLLISIAPDLDPRMEQLYSYLNDDVSRRRASTGLALYLCGSAFSIGANRSRLGPKGRLASSGLVTVEDPERPFLTRALSVPDRVVAHLLGDDHPDQLIGTALSDFISWGGPEADQVTRALESGVRLVFVQDKPGAAGLSLAATALERLGVAPIALDLNRLDAGDDLRAIATSASREALLRDGGLVAGPVDAVADRAGAVRAFSELECPVVLTGTRVWDPAWSHQVPLLVEAPTLAADDRRAIWGEALRSAHPDDLDPVAVTSQFRLNPDQVERAARAARIQAQAAGRDVVLSDLHAGARAQNAAGLERLALRVEPRASWDDLVLPRVALAQLRELTARIRHRDQVLDGWGVGTRSSRGRGISALFAGESGTGKTMSAEVVASDLGLDLYIIDLSTVIDKYIGETEKNLERIFVEADRVNGVLLFDEADALFGKRSETKDAHDRFANMEIAYLLQRMERFDGLAVLTSNLRANVDEAFTRRLDAIIDFPMPDVDDRLSIWNKNLHPGIPRAGDVDLDFLARNFRVSGGEIRNIVVSATFLAADEEKPLSMEHLIRGTEREYRKTGRLCVEDEFGPFYPLIAVG